MPRQRTYKTLYISTALIALRNTAVITRSTICLRAIQTKLSSDWSLMSEWWLLSSSFRSNFSFCFFGISNIRVREPFNGNSRSAETFWSLLRRVVAGSNKELSCRAGIPCAGLVSYCWYDVAPVWGVWRYCVLSWCFPFYQPSEHLWDLL